EAGGWRLGSESLVRRTHVIFLWCEELENARCCSRLLAPASSSQPSSGRHPDRAVQSDAFAVEHDVFAHMCDERGIFLRAAEARREGDLLAERVLRLLRQR